MRLWDISGNGFLRQVNKYLTHVVKRRPLDTQPLWKDVLAYSWVRHTIIHNDGKVLDEKALEQPCERAVRPTFGGPELAQRTDKNETFLLVIGRSV